MVSFLHTLLELLPDNHTQQEQYAFIHGLLAYHGSPRTMAAICQNLKRDFSQGSLDDELMNTSSALEQWAAFIKEELLDKSPAQRDN